MNNLRKLRLAHGLTLRELGDILHITYTALGKAENNQRNLNDNDINMICDYFNVSADYLLARTSNKNIDETTQMLTEQQRYILESIKGLTAEQLKELIKYIEFLKLQSTINALNNLNAKKEVK